jgi:Protein of unknown function (DUF3501)
MPAASARVSNRSLDLVDSPPAPTWRGRGIRNETAGAMAANGAPLQLTLDDILDLRAYERVREEFRSAVIARKRLRRVSLGPVMTLVFESVDTVRFQIQEMARAERIATDEGLQIELDIYNALLPRPGELSATVFIELTSDDELRRYLPELVGIERSLGIDVGVDQEEATTLVRGVPEAAHEAALSRDTATSAVHYLRFAFSSKSIEGFGKGPTALVSTHPSYSHRTVMGDDTRAVLLGDLMGTTTPFVMAQGSPSAP